MRVFLTSHNLRDYSVTLYCIDALIASTSRPGAMGLMEQLEEDVETTMKVTRQRRHEETEHQQRAS
jgi:hypothetical protein